MKIGSCLVLVLFTLVSLTAQNLPELKDKESLSYYRGLNNTYIVTLNQADASMIKIKSKEGTVTQINDTTFQVNNRNDAQLVELKLKLYYKNLPVDVATIPVESLPPLVVALDNKINGPITLKELLKLNLKVDDTNPVISGQGMMVQTAMVKLKRGNQITPLLNLNGESLSRLNRVAGRITSGAILLIDSFRIRNRYGQYVNVQAQPLEIQIK